MANSNWSFGSIRRTVLRSDDSATNGDPSPAAEQPPVPSPNRITSNGEPSPAVEHVATDGGNVNDNSSTKPSPRRDDDSSFHGDPSPAAGNTPVQPRQRRVLQHALLSDSDDNDTENENSPTKAYATCIANDAADKHDKQSSESSASDSERSGTKRKDNNNNNSKSNKRTKSDGDNKQESDQESDDLTDGAGLEFDNDYNGLYESVSMIFGDDEMDPTEKIAQLVATLGPAVKDMRASLLQGDKDELDDKLEGMANRFLFKVCLLSSVKSQLERDWPTKYSFKMYAAMTIMKFRDDENETYTAVEIRAEMAAKKLSPYLVISDLILDTEDDLQPVSWDEYNADADEIHKAVAHCYKEYERYLDVTDDGTKKERYVVSDRDGCSHLIQRATKKFLPSESAYFRRYCTFFFYTDLDMTAVKEMSPPSVDDAELVDQLQYVYDQIPRPNNVLPTENEINIVRPHLEKIADSLFLDYPSDNNSMKYIACIVCNDLKFGSFRKNGVKISFFGALAVALTAEKIKSINDVESRAKDIALGLISNRRIYSQNGWPVPADPRPDILRKCVDGISFFLDLLAMYFHEETNDLPGLFQKLYEDADVLSFFMKHLRLCKKKVHGNDTVGFELLSEPIETIDPESDAGGDNDGGEESDDEGSSKSSKSSGDDREVSVENLIPAGVFVTHANTQQLKANRLRRYIFDDDDLQKLADDITRLKVLEKKIIPDTYDLRHRLMAWGANWVDGGNFDNDRWLLVVARVVLEEITPACDEKRNNKPPAFRLGYSSIVLLGYLIRKDDATMSNRECTQYGIGFILRGLMTKQYKGKNPRIVGWTEYVGEAPRKSMRAVKIQFHALRDFLKKEPDLIGMYSAAYKKLKGDLKCVVDFLEDHLKIYDGDHEGMDFKSFRLKTGNSQRKDASQQPKSDDERSSAGHDTDSLGDVSDSNLLRRSDGQVKLIELSYWRTEMKFRCVVILFTRASQKYPALTILGDRRFVLQREILSGEDDPLPKYRLYSQGGNGLDRVEAHFSHEEPWEKVSVRGEDCIEVTFRNGSHVDYEKIVVVLQDSTKMDRLKSKLTEAENIVEEYICSRLRED